MTDTPIFDQHFPCLADVIPLIRKVYARHLAGCCLHILTDDGNCGQGDANFCLDIAQQHECADCMAAARLLVRLSTTQREQIYHRYDEYAR